MTPESIIEGLYLHKYPYSYAIATSMGLSLEAMEKCETYFTCSHEDFDLNFRIILTILRERDETIPPNWIDHLNNIGMNWPFRVWHFLNVHYKSERRPYMYLPALRDPVVTDIKVTRDTTYEDNIYHVTMILTDVISIIELYLEPIKSTQSAIALYDLIGQRVTNIEMTNDNGTQRNLVYFTKEARGGLGNAVLLTVPYSIPFRTMIITGRTMVDQISFINTVDTNNISIKLRDAITNESKWYNSQIDAELHGTFILVEKLFKIWKNEKSCILDKDILYFGDLTLPVYTVEKGE